MACKLFNADRLFFDAHSGAYVILVRLVSLVRVGRDPTHMSLLLASESLGKLDLQVLPLVTLFNQ